MNASLEEARSGILNGTYGAFIVIPPSFSDAVESINEFPQKAELSYTINPNLSDATKLIVTEEVVEYLSSMNDTLSYVYVTSIMSEFHDVQDGSKIILEHDIEDLNNIISIDLGKLSTDIEYTPLQQTDYKWEYVDLSEYSDRNEEYINNIDKYYEEVHQKLSEKYKEIDDGAKSAAQQYADVKSQIGAFDPFNDEAGNSVLDGGFARLETEVARTDVNKMNSEMQASINQNKSGLDACYYEAVTDITNGVTNRIIYGNDSRYYVHSKEDYWKSDSGLTAEELFAEFFSYNMTGNIEKVNITREYFPLATLAIDEMVGR